MSSLLLIDADILAYQVAARNQATFQWPDAERSVIVADFAEAADELHGAIVSLQQRLGADEVAICLSDDFVNWRKDILPTYKGNRAATERPELLYPLKEWLAERPEAMRRPTLEADDVMGIMSTHPRPKGYIGWDKVIVSIDKDMQSIPGWLFNPDKDDEPRWITPESADYYHLFQTLTGDVCDNYKGCPGIGPVKAHKVLLENAEDPWSAIVDIYEAKGLTEADALVQAQVARICRYSDYNFKDKKVIPWKPKKL